MGGVLAGCVVGGDIVGSVGALIFQRRWRVRKAKKADNTKSLIIMDRISNGGQGANKLLHTWVCIC